MESGTSLMIRVMLLRMPGIMMKMKDTGITLMKAARWFMVIKISLFGNGLMMGVMLLMKKAECIVIVLLLMDIELMRAGCG